MASAVAPPIPKAIIKGMIGNTPAKKDIVIRMP
jgi:hypothetical protein